MSVIILNVVAPNKVILKNVANKKVRRKREEMNSREKVGQLRA